MMREWRRLYRLRGFTPFGVLLVVLLAVLVVVDRAAERWSDAAQRREAAERKLATVRAALERGRRIDASLDSARRRLAAVAGRVISTPDPVAASDRLAQATRTWLVSLGAVDRPQVGQAGVAANGAVKGKTAGSAAAKTSGAALGSGSSRHGSTDAPGVATADVAVRMTTRQLIRMLEKWRETPLALRLVRLEVTVDNPEAPKALQTSMRVEGVYQGSAPASGGAPSATRPSTARNAR